MDNMDEFAFIFNMDKKVEEKIKQQNEDALNKAMSELYKNEDLEQLKHHMHTKNQIILQLLRQCDAYSEVVTEIIKSASAIPDVDTNMKTKIGVVSKALNEHKKLNEMLKMAIEFEESMDL